MSIIKSLSVGDGDMFYIKHDSDSFTIIDCCMNEDVKEDILSELLRESSGKRITRFISTHPDDDHIRGLDYLNAKMPIVNFYCVMNAAVKNDPTVDFKEYCRLRESERSFWLEEGCKREWLNVSDSQMDSAGIDVLWPVTSNESYAAALQATENGANPNNISPIIKYSVRGGVTVLWMGDMETDFMAKIEDDVNLGAVDILFAPHHSRKSGKPPKSWLNALQPKIVVLGEAPSEHIDYYRGYNTIKQNSAGDMLFDNKGSAVHIYVESSSYSESFLINLGMPSAHGLLYLGTFICK